MQHLIENMSDRYDLIIIDTPPVLAVSAANMIASIAGSSVIVVRPDAESERELEETIRQLERTGACVIGVILNGIPRDTAMNMNMLRPMRRKAYRSSGDIGLQQRVEPMCHRLDFVSSLRVASIQRMPRP
jgi:Mrp family chromosome partitioning ATPase